MVVLGRGITGLPLASGSLLVGVDGIVDELFIGTPGQVLSIVDNPNAAQADYVQWTTPATGGGTGDINGGQNLIGSGAGVFSAKSGTLLQFRRISSGSSNVTVTENVNDISIAVAAAPVTSVNTLTGAVSLGLNNLNNVTGTPTSGQVLTWNGTMWAPATVQAGGTGEANTGTNLGTGVGVYASKSAATLQFNSIKAGTGISVVLAGNEITITNTSPATGQTGITSVGLASPNSTITVANSPLLANGTLNIDLPVQTGVAGTYARITNVTVDAYGRVTAATAGTTINYNKFLTFTGNTGTVTAASDTSTMTISGTDVTTAISGTTMTLSLGNVSGLTPGAYTNASITVDAKGRITLASNGTLPSTFGSVITDAGTAPASGSASSLTLNGINGVTTSVLLGAVKVALTTTGVTAGSYGAATGTAAQITVDAYGRISAAVSKSVLQTVSNDLNPTLGGNLNVGAYEISTTSTNGNIVLRPNGTGSINASNSKIINLATPVAGTDAATKAYVDAAIIGGSASLDSLTDVVISSPTVGQTLVYNDVSGQWENNTPATTLAQLTDVNVTNIAVGKYLQYDGTAWVPADIVVGTLSLDTLNDVTIGTLGDRDILTYDQTTSQWINIQSPYLETVTVLSDSGVATSAADTIKIVGGIGITTSGNADTLTITNSINTITSLTDVVLNGAPSINDVLAWTGSEWSQYTIPNYALNAITDITADDSNTITATGNNQAIVIAGLNGVTTSVTGSTLNISVQKALGDLSNVNVANAQDGNVLYYNQSSAVWQSGNIPVAFANLTDTNVSSLANGYILVYDAGTNKWVSVVPSTIDQNIFSSIAADNGTGPIVTSTPTTAISILGKSTDGIYTESDPDNNVLYVGQNMSLDNLSDVVVLGTPITNQILQYNGSNWVNSNLNITVALNDLTDVIISTPLNNQLVSYNGSNWVNSAIDLRLNAQTGGYLPLNSLTSSVMMVGSNGIDTIVSGNTMTFKFGALLGQIADVDVLTVSPNGGEVLAFNGSTGKWEPLASGQFSLISDGSPTLGANLNVNGFRITSPTDTNVLISPGGTGVVDLGNVFFGQRTVFVADASGTPAIISSYAVDYEYTAIDYHYSSTTGRRIGTLMVLNDGTDTSMTDTGTELGAPVFDFTVAINALLVELTIEPEADARLIYTIRQMSV